MVEFLFSLRSETYNAITFFFCFFFLKERIPMYICICILGELYDCLN